MNTISDDYKALNEELHRTNQKYGAGGAKHGPFVSNHISKYDSQTVLDYGCGKGLLSKFLMEVCDFLIVNYDPAIEAHSEDPQDDGPFDLLTCTDVLEHIEPECLDDVLKHMRACAGEFMYLEIATRPDQSKTLPDGTNPHKIIKDSLWWKARLLEAWPDVTCFSVLDNYRGLRVRFLIRF